MGRISQAELEIMDLEWFAIDQKGQVAVFCSAGVGNVPEFVCADEDKSDTLMKVFDLLPVSSDVEICFKECKFNSRPIEVAKGFSSKGLFYYDSDDNSKKEQNVSSLQEYYTISSRPIKPILFDELPADIKKLMSNNILQIEDFGKQNVIEIDNAY